MKNTVQYYYSFKSFRVFRAFVSRDVFIALDSVATNKDVIATKPDKGRRVVILVRMTHVTKITALTLYLLNSFFRRFSGHSLR